MSLNFPNSPVDREFSAQPNGVTYQWDAAKERWDAVTSPGQDIVAGTVVQVQNVQDGAVATGTTILPSDTTIPQQTEGDEYMTLAFTPKFADSVLRIESIVQVSSSIPGAGMSAAMFRDATADAIASAMAFYPDATGMVCISLSHMIAAGSVAPTTFKIRAGADQANTMTFNGRNGGITQGGVMTSHITITEIQPNAVVPQAARVAPEVIWGRSDGATGAVTRKNNQGRQMSGTRTVQGNYAITFDPPMANADYNVQLTSNISSSGVFPRVQDQTVNGFNIVSLANTAAGGEDASMYILVTSNVA